MAKGNPKPKAGPGRPKGSLNKIKILKVDVALAQLGVEPVHQILALVKDGKLADKDKARIWLELLSYCHPKPREVEMTDDMPEDLKEVETAKLLSLVNSQK